MSLRTSGLSNGPPKAGTDEIARNRTTGQPIRGTRRFRIHGGPRARQLPVGAMVLQGFGLAGHVSRVVFACTQVKLFGVGCQPKNALKRFFSVGLNWPFIVRRLTAQKVLSKLGHNISAVIIRGDAELDLLLDYDTVGFAIGQGLSLVWMDHIYTGYWARRLGIEGTLPLPESIDEPQLLPHDAVIAELVRVAAGDGARFAVVWTDYFGGVGEQLAAAYIGDQVIETDGTINGALRACG